MLLKILNQQALITGIIRRMLKMTEISNIRNLYFKEGKNITEINRITGKDRKTIKYYIEKGDWTKTKELEKIEKTFTKLDPYKAEIDKWHTDDKKAKKKKSYSKEGF